MQGLWQYQQERRQRQEITVYEVLHSISGSSIAENDGETSIKQGLLKFSRDKITFSDPEFVKALQSGSVT